MTDLKGSTTTDLIARMSRIQNGYEPVTSDVGGDTVLLLLRLNIAADQINQGIKQLLNRKQA